MLPHQRTIKRVFDITLSLLGLLLLWPVIIGCVVIARLDTGLPGLFVQSRVGQFGSLIQTRKIRTMRNLPDVNTTVTVAGDKRITVIGAIMRRWKLDELPQLWNVLLGEMSFVGPRPDVPGYADTLSGADREVLNLKPGITGPATIKYRNEEELLSQAADAKQYNDSVIYPDKVKINLDYMRHWSLLNDVKYILMTCLLYTSPSPRDQRGSRMPSSA